METDLIEEFLGKHFLVPQTFSMLLGFIIIFIVVVAIGVKFRKYDPRKVNSTFQIFGEWFYSFFENMVRSMLGEKYITTFTPLATIMFLSVFLSNIVGVIFMKEAALLNPVYTFTWSLSMFFVWNVYAIYKVGFKTYFKNAYIGEVKILAPVETLGYFSKPISLGARMLGNISAGAVIVYLIWQVPGILGSITDTIALSIPLELLGVAVSTGLGIVFMGFFSLFGPYIQAMVFTHLTLSYFAGVLSEEE